MNIRLRRIHADLIAMPLLALALATSILEAPRAEAAPTSNLTTKELQPQDSQKSAQATQLEGTWKVLLSAQDSRDEMNQSSGVIYKGDLNLRYSLAPWLVLNGAPSLVGKSGHIQADTDVGPQSADTTGLVVRNATADFLFLQNSRLQVGVANQKEVHSSLLIDDRGFPAARLQLKASEKNYFQWKTFAQAAVPTSASLTTNSREFEATPSFNSAGLVAGIHSADLEWHNQVALFEYKNLPMNIATSSGLLGNTVQVTNSTDAQFIYDYKGVEIQTDLATRWGRRWLTKAIFAGLQNGAAPKGYNTGAMGQLEATYQMNSQLSLSPFAQSFRVEPDASVAAYSSNLWHANTVGYRGGLKSQFSQRFSLTAAGGERAPIYENPAQSKERFIELTLETLDAKF